MSGFPPPFRISFEYYSETRLIEISANWDIFLETELKCVPTTM